MNHGNAVFSPSDIWYTVCLSYSKYANENTDDIKQYIDPTFNGNKKLLLLTVDVNNWDESIDQMITNITQTTYKPELIQILKNDLLCASAVEKMGCKIAVLKTTEKFNKYHFIRLCGFNAIKLLGCKNDWILTRSKALQLKEYGSLIWKIYIDKVVNILDNFITSFDENSNIKDFINDMIHQGLKFGFYGDETNTISGWILNLFYGFKNEYIISELPNLYAEIDATFDEYYIKITTKFCTSSATTNDSNYNKTNLAYIEWNAEPNYGINYEPIMIDSIQDIYDFRPVICCKINCINQPSGKIFIPLKNITNKIIQTGTINEPLNTITNKIIPMGTSNEPLNNIDMLD